MEGRQADTSGTIDDVLRILSRPDDPELLDVVRLAADLCEAEAAGLTILKDAEYHVRVTHGVEPMVCAADDTFCTRTMTTEGGYFVEDALADPRFADIGWVDGRFSSARFYGSAPLYAPDGTMVGRLCVIDSKPKVISSLQQRALEALANSVTSVIKLRLSREHSTRSTQSPPQSLAAMSHLAAELSHDMRVPLTSILASMEMLEDELGQVDPAVGMLVRRASSAALRMNRMLEQIMRFGSVDDHPELTDVDLQKLLTQLVQDSTTLLEVRSGTVELGVLPQLRADPDQLYSLFQNLVTNAVKFSRRGVPPVIRISASPAGSRWRISVVDNGIGIPEDRRDDVFALFSRVDPAIEGHGIGLATAARIVSAHGGTIGANAAPGGGTEIWFELPGGRDVPQLDEPASA